MAFYEMLPGAGMPSGLQAGMDSVLNKKFGTSTTYPAEGWPDTVNLMGPLPEKTVSGAIVAFADGADAVPLKKCEITLPASLDGYSEVDVIHAGKNLWEFGDNTVSTTYIMFTLTTPLPAGTYTVSAILSSTHTSADMRFRKEDGSAIINCNINAGSPNRTSRTITLTEPAYKIYLYSSQGQVGNTATWKDIQIEAGSTMTDFEAYIAPTTHTASLGRTIHGGKADVVNGQGTDGYIKYVIDGVNVYGYLTGSNNMNIMPYGLNIDGTISKWLCDTLTANSTNFGYNSNQGFIFIRQAGWSSIPNVTDEATFNAYCQENPITLILPLATPETFTFDPVPIDSKSGNNTLWSEQGSAEVTYRADINLALGGN